jgi:hypothetical protein
MSSNKFGILCAEVTRLKEILVYIDRLISKFNALNDQLAYFKPMILDMLENNKEDLQSNEEAKNATEIVKNCLEKQGMEFVSLGNLSTLGLAMDVIRDRVMHCRAEKSNSQSNNSTILPILIRPKFQPSRAKLFVEPRNKDEVEMMTEKKMEMEKAIKSRVKQIRELVKANSDMSVPMQKRNYEKINFVRSFIVFFDTFDNFVGSRIYLLNRSISSLEKIRYQ